MHLRGLGGENQRFPQFAMVAQRRPRGAILALPCSLGFRLAASATGGARLRPQPDSKGPGISPRKRPKARRSVARALATEQRRRSDGLLR